MNILQLRTYPIYVGNVYEQVLLHFRKGKYSQVIFLVDENTRRYCLPRFQELLSLRNPTFIEIEAGEKNKSLSTCATIWQRLLDLKADRRSLLVNLGGGVIGDMGGFCASTYKRGMPFIQIPTTLLSQVDSSIGSKLGIDFGDVKNSVGLFRDPEAVFISHDFLETLSAREIRSGYAEMIKHSLIADAKQWELQRKIKQLHKVKWEELILPSLKIKQGIVEEDPYERTVRKALNFGHTIGHAIESYALNSEKPLLHGEAIAYGMICEAWLSVRVAGLSAASAAAIATYLNQLYGQYEIPADSHDALINLMLNDKKNEDGEIRLTLLDSIGKFRINCVVEPEMIRGCLTAFHGMQVG